VSIPFFSFCLDNRDAEVIEIVGKILRLENHVETPSDIMGTL
jgi:hypothetical protein